MPIYNESFKSKLVQKMLMPNPRPVTLLAEEAGVPEATLYRWKKEVTLRGMSDERREKKPAAPKSARELSAQEKLELVLEAAAVPEAELGAFLRRKGLHAAQLEEWRRQVIEAGVAALEQRPSKAAQKAAAKEARRVRELERELRRKDKALAEAAALLVLKKKAQAIWGDEDDDTDPRSDD